MPGKDWSMKEINFLRDNYKVMPMAKLVSSLGRSKAAIHNQAQRMKFKRPHSGGQVRIYDRGRIKLLIMRGFSTGQIAKELGAGRRTISTIMNKEMPECWCERLQENNRINQVELMRKLGKANKKRAA